MFWLPAGSSTHIHTSESPYRSSRKEAPMSLVGEELIVRIPPCLARKLEREPNPVIGQCEAETEKAVLVNGEWWALSICDIQVNGEKLVPKETALVEAARRGELALPDDWTIKGNLWAHQTAALWWALEQMRARIR